VIQDSTAVNGQQQSAGVQETADGTLADLAEVQKQIVELIGHLDRPPRNLHIEAGAITVDITWADVPTAVVAGASKSTAAGPIDETHGDDKRQYLTSPAVGVFYRAPQPGAEPFVSLGSVVRPGQQIGIVEAMKLMIPVEADRGGRIIDILKANGEPVEYDEPLFELEAEEP
jgi:acetyl-CoA carboxylase biotin carboxyl carrier protein